MNALKMLDRVTLDWSKPNEASRIAREMVEDLGADRAALRTLTLSVAKNDRLRALAEKHDELNYIVLYDALDRGLRVRLHRFSHGLEDIPHNHRFYFSSFILSGSYVHTLFGIQEPDACAEGSEPWQLDQPDGTHPAVKLDNVAASGLVPLLTTTQSAGSSYSLQHNAIHKTAMPVEDAYSLFLRSPAQKPCALQFVPNRKTYRWKFGREHEETEVIASRAMAASEYDRLIESFEEAHVI